MKFAPGTPESVMRDREEKFYGNKNKRNETTPPLKITTEMREKAAAADAVRKAAAATTKPRTAVEDQAMERKAVADATAARKAAADDVARRGAAATTSPPLPPPRPMPPPRPETGGPLPPPPQPPRPVQPTPPRPVQPVAVAQKAINAVPKLNIAPQNTNPAPNVNAAADAASKFGSALKQMRLKSGGNVSKSSSASKRGDGIAQRGKTKGRMV